MIIKPLKGYWGNCFVNSSYCLSDSSGIVSVFDNVHSHPFADSSEKRLYSHQGHRKSLKFSPFHVTVSSNESSSYNTYFSVWSDINFDTDFRLRLISPDLSGGEILLSKTASFISHSGSFICKQL